MNRAVKTWIIVMSVFCFSASVIYLVLFNRPDPLPSPSAESTSLPLLPAPIRAAASAPSLSDPLASLYAAAIAEGAVEIWGSTIDDLAWVPAAFAKEFPGIRVNVHISSDVVNRTRSVLEENNDMDVVWTAEAYAQSLSNDHLLAEGDWLKLGPGSWDIGASGHMAITNSAVFAIAYRNDLVASEDVPRFWLELTEDKYRGKLAADPRSLAHLCSALGSFEGAMQWLEFAREFSDESETVWTRNVEDMINNQPYVIAVRSHLADGWRAQNLPIDVVLPEPVFITQFGSVVVRNAPHPNSARLLALWLASPEGKVAREQATHAVDLRPESMHPKAVDLRNSGKLVYYDTAAAMDARHSLLPKMQLVISLLARNRVRPSE